MSFGDTFDGYCVVHASFAAPERRPLFEKSLREAGVNSFHVIEAPRIENNDPRLPPFNTGRHLNPNASLSLIEAFKKCICYAEENGWKNILIFEDDIVFRREFPIWWSEVEREIKSFDWEILFLYRWHKYLLKEPKSATSLVPIDSTLCTHCFAVRDSAYSTYKEALNLLAAQGFSVDSSELHHYLLSHGARVVATSRNLAGQSGLTRSVVSSLDVRENTLADMFRIDDRSCTELRSRLKNKFRSYVNKMLRSSQLPAGRT